MFRDQQHAYKTNSIDNNIKNIAECAEEINQLEYAKALVKAYNREGISHYYEQYLARVETESIIDNLKIFKIQYGGKILFIEYDKGSQMFSTHIIRSENEKIENDTSHIYYAAKMIMKKLLIKDGKKSGEYWLDTGNQTMALWALSTGREIFDWNECFIDDQQIDLKKDRDIQYKLKGAKRIRLGCSI